MGNVPTVCQQQAAALLRQRLAHPQPRVAWLLKQVVPRGVVKDARESVGWLLIGISVLSSFHSEPGKEENGSVRFVAVAPINDIGFFSIEMTGSVDDLML